jgi:hypothetical protein
MKFPLFPRLSGIETSQIPKFRDAEIKNDIQNYLQNPKFLNLMTILAALYPCAGRLPLPVQKKESPPERGEEETKEAGKDTEENRKEEGGKDKEGAKDKEEGGKGKYPEEEEETEEELETRIEDLLRKLKEGSETREDLKEVEVGEVVLHVFGTSAASPTHSRNGKIFFSLFFYPEFFPGIIPPLFSPGLFLSFFRDFSVLFPGISALFFPADFSLF